ncbi:MAG: arginase [Planctomycetes bacterium]|nr:arginase [Planctomycetota bacterium]
MTSRSVHVIGMPLDHGAGRRGVGMGPTAIRIARLHEALGRLGYEVHEHGDVHVSIPESLEQGDTKAKYLRVVAEACRELSAQVKSVLDQGALPLVIGGDHSLAIGSISGAAHHLVARAGGDGQAAPKLGLLWFDAHADINTPETSVSGNIHGMPVACLLHRGPDELRSIGYDGPKLAPERVVQVGLRDIDRAEKRLVKESGIYAFTMADIDRRGLARVVEEAIDIATRDCDLLHVSFDIDVMDPRVAPGTGTPVLGGLSFREAHLALEMVAESGRLGSFELVEVNPILDEQNRTAEIGVDLIASALGKTIL